MYEGVPAVLPGAVTDAARGPAMAFAIPKSARTALEPDRKMLPGLMSRCTTPLA